MSLSFPVKGFDQDPSGWDTRTVKNAGWANERTVLGTTLPFREGVGVFVGVAEIPRDGYSEWWGKVEANPSRILEPGGIGLASPSELMAAVGFAVGVAQRVVDPDVEDVREMHVKRLDLAKDMECESEPATLIRALGALHRPHAKRNLTHSDPKLNGAQTLSVGNGSGMARLYDKAEETKGVAPDGTVRWEVECRSWADRHGGLKVLGDATPEAMEALALNRWEWSQMGAEVAGSTGRLVQAVRDSDLTSRERRAFLGWLVEQSAGMTDEDGMSRATLAKYRRLQRELRIVAPADFGAMAEVVRRLDWETGREVVRYA